MLLTYYSRNSILYAKDLLQGGVRLVRVKQGLFYNCCLLMKHLMLNSIFKFIHFLETYNLLNFLETY